MTKKAVSLSLDDEVIEAVDKAVEGVPGLSRSVYANIVLGGAAGLFDANEALAKLFAAASLGEALTRQAKTALVEELQNEVQK